MPSIIEGIFNLYKDNAQEYVEHRVRKTHTIDRAQFELTLYDQIAKSDLDPNFKIAWCHAFLYTDEFDSFWKPHTEGLSLSWDQVQRYQPIHDLFDYEISSRKVTLSSTPEPPPTNGYKDYVPEVTQIQKRQEKEDGAFRPSTGLREPGAKVSKGGKKKNPGPKKGGKRVRFSQPLEM